MPQIAVNSVNIETFGFSCTFDIFQRKIIFDTTDLTVYETGGAANVKGIAFSLVDQDGVELMTINWSSPQLPDPNTTKIYEFDASSFGLPFLFQRYTIIGAIQDADNTVYSTVAVKKTVCKPASLNTQGYVPGIFQMVVDCLNNNLVVKELTNLVLNGKEPVTVTKDGTLYYPTGTLSPLTFEGTPFSNDRVYSGQYRISCETVGTYDLDDDIYVAVTYKTDNVFDATCMDSMSSVACCIMDLVSTYNRNCTNEKGAFAKEQLDSIQIPLMAGFVKQITGKDASGEAALIRKMLNCDCGVNSIVQNEMTPINPSVYSIVINGVGGTTIGAPDITGTTKTWEIASNIYQVVKGDTGDLAYTIEVDTSVAFTVKYKLTFNYNLFAGKILDAIAADDSLKAQLNSLIVDAGLSLQGLDGKCVINLGVCDYVISRDFAAKDKITQIVIDGTNYTAPDLLNFLVPGDMANWLNSLGLGVWTVSYNAGIGTIQSNGNTHLVATASFRDQNDLNPRTYAFASTCQGLLQILQAIIDFLCNLTACQIALCNAVNLYYFDYNGVLQFQSFTNSNSQGQYNDQLAISIESIAKKVADITAVTCEAIAAAFPDSPSDNFGVSARMYGNSGAGCVAFTNKQVALGVLAAINAYSDVKDVFCAINCNEPSTCPEVSGINLNIVGSDIGIYGNSWSATPSAVQTVTVQYKLSSSPTWLTATSSLQILPNGNINGTTPFLISGLTAGQTYNVRIINNCGGVGFTTSITVPTGAVYSGNFLLDTVLYDICGDSPVVLYSSAPFATGIIMYTDVGLTTPVTGYDYIADSNVGEIFAIDNTTGEVGATTGTSCNTGIPGKFILANSTGAVCAGSFETLYTNGSFAPGGTLYHDSALTSPVTGFSFVYWNGDDNIYNLNSVTGQIGSITGSSCSVFSNLFRLGASEGAACVAGPVTLYSAAPFQPGVAMYTNAGLTVLATGHSFIIKVATGDGYTINFVSAIVGPATGNTC